MINKKTFWKKFNPLFWITVLIPTLFSIVYFGFLASDIYISEASFVVRSPSNQSSLSGVGALLQGSGFSRSQDDTYTVQEYMRSRNALEQLQQVLPVREFYETKGDILSRFNLFGFSNEQESFYQYFKNKVSVNFDSVSGIATLNIRAFNSLEAQKINIQLLKQGENLINRLNTRARRDTISFAEQAVQEAEKRVNETALALSEYRTQNNIFDLSAQSEVQLTLISKLKGELINVQSQLAQLRDISPNNPQIKTLLTREKNLISEINQQAKSLTGDNNSIATQSSEYQRLILDNTLSQQQFTTAITALQNTKRDADRQQLYLEVINTPSNPDLALEPHRLYNIISTFIIGLILYGIFSLLIASIREHKN
ncbi:capsular polysaccharide transport system permease protein [Bisgaardia hudsonensis]|uniref:Capsular polysaccharide transport system permease protein n=1 Tax=Bisgaardia hudsonensis TaxID=109472 RepID=A0A4R2N2Y9_9PAST|nr:capsule biosynthesis protein [Bisgaardia hudsonensis]QLB12716.1 capsule biosynthesis protein [Bisgaardia hudsonensis]TCP14266.1 capsular polysaccharide transport system permease protein [Bisgaardia hudsonensis]